MNSPVYKILLLLFSASVISNILAEQKVQQLNLREQCRREVAGAYLVAFDEIRHSKIQIDVFSKKLKQLNVEFKKEEIRLHDARIEVNNKQYDNSLIAVVNNSYIRKNAIKENILSFRLLKIRAEQVYENFSTKNNKIINLVKKYFKVTAISHKDGGYVFDVNYKTKCNKYDIACSLTVNGARSLKLFLKKFDKINSESLNYCIKYSDYKA